MWEFRQASGKRRVLSLCVCMCVQIEEDRRKDSTYFNRRCRYDKKVEKRFFYQPSSQPQGHWINAPLCLSASCLCPPASNIERTEANGGRLQWGAEDWTQHCKTSTDQSWPFQLFVSSFLPLRLFLFVFESLGETPCLVTHFSPGSFTSCWGSIITTWPSSTARWSLSTACLACSSSVRGALWG